MRRFTGYMAGAAASLLLVVGGVSCGGGGPETQTEAQSGLTTGGPAVRTSFECPRDRVLNPDEAQAYHHDAMPSVWESLEKAESRACWGSAIAVLGFAGGSESFARIQAFIEARAPLFALSEDVVVVQRAFMALGHLVKESKHERSSEQALAYLVEASDPLNWVKRSIDWKLDAVIRRELIRTMTVAAVSALAITGRDDANDRLMVMAADSADRRALAFKFHVLSKSKDTVEDLVNLHVLPPGRVVFAMTATLTELKDSPDKPMRVFVERVRNQALRTWDEEQKWLRSRRGEEGFLQAVRAADRIADARLNGFDGQLESLVHLIDDPELRKAIEEIKEVVFPDGPHIVVSAEYAEQVGYVLAAMNRLREEHAHEVVTLKLANHVDTVTEAHLALQRALNSGQRGAGFDAVISARAALQRVVRVLIARAVSKHPGWNEGDRPERMKVIGSLLVQNRQVDNYLRRRRPVRDVNPETGQELAPLEEGGAPSSDDGPKMGDQ